MNPPFVALLPDAETDLPAARAAREVLHALEIPHELRLLPPQRQAERLHAYVHEAEARGCATFLCLAGQAALLAAQILALRDADLAARLRRQRTDEAAAALRRDAELRSPPDGD